MKKNFSNSNVLLHLSIILGWCFLFFNLFTTPFKFDFKWVIIFLITMAIINTVWIGGLWIYLKLVNKDWEWLENSIPQKTDLKGFLPWFLYTPGEDGLCFVPLLYIGDNYFTAGIFSLIFGCMHRFNFPFWACVQKAIAFCIVALLILPKSGIAPLIVGHWLLDIFWIYIYPKIYRGSFPYKHHYENGILKEEGRCLNSKREGAVKFYYPNGKIHSEIYFSKDSPDGPAKWFYENGKMEKEGSYKAGKLQNLFKWYKEDGSLIAEGTYENDHIVGEIKHY